ncbi:MAG: ATP-dependent helicase [Deinococcaceae bacterium]
MPIALTPEQQAIVDHDFGPAIVFAVAGAGKTTAMVHRIRRLVEQKVFLPGEILATSFSRATVEDIKKELRGSPETSRVKAMTLHSLGLSILQRAQQSGAFPYRLDQLSEFEASKILKKAMALARNQGLFDNLSSEPAEEDILNYIACCKGNFRYAQLDHAALSALPYATQAEAPEHLPEYLEIYRLFETVRQEDGTVTFEDLLLSGWECLHRCPGLLEQFQGQIGCILVDEFQDVNRVQAELVHVLSAPNHNLMAIGDDDQTIYGWRGASPQFILGFQERYSAVPYVISENFRCKASHIALANRVISPNIHRVDKRLSLTGGFSGSTQLHLETTRPNLGRCLVAEIQKNLDSDVSLSHMVVLVRAYAQTPDLEIQLFGAGIPHQVVGAPVFFERPEVLLYLSHLRLALGSLSHSAFWQSWNTVMFGHYRGLTAPEIRALGEQVLGSKRPIDQALLGCAQGHPKAKLLSTLVQNLALCRQPQPVGDIFTALEARLKHKIRLRQSAEPQIADMRVHTVDAFLGCAARSERTADSFLDWIDGLKRQAAGWHGQPNLNIMSIHRSKGLEWDHVFIPHVNESVFPWGQENLEDERRLLYVAITRAREHLHLFAVQDEPLSPMLVEADVQNLLQAVRWLARGLHVPIEKWNTAQTLAFARYPRLLHFERYFLHWSAHDLGQIASKVLRLFEQARHLGILDALKLHAGDLEFWENVNPSPDLTAQPGEFPDFDRWTQPAKTPKAEGVPKGWIGRDVLHPIWGSGVIMAGEHRKPHTTLTIAFDRVGVKKLVFELSDLSIDGVRSPISLSR